jgi:hypothetical protein
VRSKPTEVRRYLWAARTLTGVRLKVSLASLAGSAEQMSSLIPNEKQLVAAFHAIATGSIGEVQTRFGRKTVFGKSLGPQTTEPAFDGGSGVWFSHAASG